MKKKLLIIANHRIDRSPGQSFRFEQYLDLLSEEGFDITFSNIISEEDDKYLYQKGNILKKLNLQLSSWRLRINDLKRADDFDVIFIFREALLTRSTYFEKVFCQSKAKVVFDFDDAIWLPNVSEGNKALQKLKSPDKIKRILPEVDLIFAGNNYLADFSRNYNQNVRVVPTTIDTNYHVPNHDNKEGTVCIGWTGTQTTLKYLNLLKPVFKELKRKFGDKVYFKVICDTPFKLEGLEIKNEKWNKEKEIQQLEEIDIGVMPLTDDQWSRGKCGFKGLQYMAMEAATLMSPVGVNQEIIDHGINGYLVNSENEWVTYISELIENPELRKKIGQEGRKTIIEKYSVDANKHRYIDYFNELLNN